MIGLQGDEESARPQGTGSEGHRKAAAYVAEHFKAAGLTPAGTSGYLQPVQFTSRTIVEAEALLEQFQQMRKMGKFLKRM